MPRPSQFRIAAACALALCVALAFTANASALQATLRVVGKGNEVLTEGLVTSKGASVKTSSKATCFGGGTGGSGKSVAVPGNTALGLLATGAQSIKELAPLSIQITSASAWRSAGSARASPRAKASWYLKINHKGAAVSGNKAKIKAGDEVLWDLAPSYPYPEELVVSAPQQASAGVPFAVHVYAYNEKGKQRPVQGAAVTGAIGPTDKSGKVMITLTEPTSLIAGLGEDIPSAAAPVCLGSQCPVGS